MEIVLKIDQHKKEAKALIEYLKNLPFVEIENMSSKKRYNTETEKAINDARSGNTYPTNLEELRKQFYS
ncbi:MAG TPA: hypothetical protein DCM02_06920 [Flavobacterium sp.]|nr:hypothetical protein [Flavobacterium sp.]HAT77499.1 hypothetical protein [Flavobacterium sp.]HAT81047.1 hypothetical protein [Flavobacterium sp.]